MFDGPPDFHLNLAAASLLEIQAQRSKQILERIAAHFAAIEARRPDEFKDLVEEKHIRRAAEFLFGSIDLPASSANIFISFSHEDKEFVGELSDKLTSQGLSHFKSDRDIRPASDWGEAIWEAIRACDVFLCVLTPRYLNSSWRDLEAGAAVASKKKVITVLRYVERKDVQPPFDRWQSLVVETANQLEMLVESVRQLLRETQDKR